MPMCELGVSWLCLSQSKSCVGSCSHQHRSGFSKSHAVGAAAVESSNDILFYLHFCALVREVHLRGKTTYLCSKALWRSIFFRCSISRTGRRVCILARRSTSTPHRCTLLRLERVPAAARLDNANLRIHTMLNATHFAQVLR